MSTTTQQLPLFDAPPSRPLPHGEEPPHFGGVTYDPALDADRLTRQLGRVYAVLSDGRWRTLAEIGAATRALTGQHDTEAAISARCRDLRKRHFGGYVVERRRRGNPASGLHEYRLAGRQGEAA